ncbi:ABC transporter substrate-binding protein [Leifsonia aquatica]|uniref:ABC transporter, substrate-binding protein, family 3 n=2 Tax=Leifsonia aquatica TaxID=144185 RepID=U2RMB0_LEIAQ|nr:ABC transporter substrate-binding protein [Leifsonia aquatica]ERK69961.1 ABC transporter, substrate-binding protein, family 3 [Leifsonia aquatica ATCC 14665]MBB2967135.1 polar amino acid transport system substrate-binding protein [Leifsonia aquatica]
MRIRSVAPVAAFAAVAALALTGCVDNSTPSSSGTSTSSAAAVDVKKDDALAASLPEKIKSAGKLVVGMDNTYPPNEYKDDNSQPVGWEVDLTNAIAAKLGVKVEFAIAKFDNIIPSVAGGKDDFGMSSFTDTTEREQQVDFVNYYSAGILWASAKGKTVDPDNACGLKVAVQSTTYEDTDEVPAKSKACTDAGKAAIQVLRYDTQDDATNAVILGKADALSADSPVTLYAISKTDGKLQEAGKTFDEAPYGLPVAKGSDLTPVLQKTVQALIDDGSYGKILDKWGVSDGAVTKAEVNAASKG